MDSNLEKFSKLFDEIMVPAAKSAIEEHEKWRAERPWLHRFLDAPSIETLNEVIGETN